MNLLEDPIKSKRVGHFKCNQYLIIILIITTTTTTTTTTTMKKKSSNSIGIDH
jgi:predicted membrane channel-forming protein YqfA (hemolysin III family)